MAASGIASAQVGLDGYFGSEWSSAPKIQVEYDPNAPQSNFGTPGTTNHTVAYDIYMRGDADYLYVLLATDESRGGSADSAFLFGNLYFDANGSDASNGSTFGIEINNDRAFVPGVSGYYDLTSQNFAYSAVNDAGYKGIEMALGWDYLMTDPQGMGFATAGVGDTVRLRLSQSFGYSVAGGSAYGDYRLGEATAVPEPASLVFGIVGIAAWLRKRKSA